MILSDGTLRRLIKSGELAIEPLTHDQIQPASIDVRLGKDFLVFRNNTLDSIDPFNLPNSLVEKVSVEQNRAFVLHPGEFVLGTTIETVGMPNNLVARVEGKSSLGRLGLLIHATAGFIDPLFTGQITLELSNVATLPIKLWPTMRIGQLSFHQMDAPAERPYGHPSLGSKYQNQSGPVASQYHKNLREQL